MKQLLILTTIFLLGTQVNAQTCTRTGTFIGAGDVDVKGTVTLEEQNDGSILLKLSSDFNSDAGPDLDIYLGSSDRVNGSSIKLQALSSLTGAQTYSLPGNFTMNQFEYITIHCTQYSHYYGAAQLGVISGSCQTLGTNIIEGTKGVKFTTTGNQLVITSDQTILGAQLNVYDLSGSLINQQVVNLSVGQTTFESTNGVKGAKIAVLTTSNGVYSATLIW